MNVNKTTVCQGCTYMYIGYERKMYMIYMYISLSTNWLPVLLSDHLTPKNQIVTNYQANQAHHQIAGLYKNI